MNKDLHFVKFHGAGNDFILIDNRIPITLSHEEIAKLCDRHMGIGADGLILLEKPKTSGTHFWMRYFNADGHEASLCGNGSRCVVAFANSLGIISKKAIFEAFDGLHTAEIINTSDGHFWQISLDMHDVSVIETFEDGLFLNTGSPHFVVPVEEVIQYNVFEEGKKLRYDSRFVGGTNVNFFSVYQNGIFVRTYERGVEAETWSCGTGVTATALAWAKLQKFPDGMHHVAVYARGGNFDIAFQKRATQYTSIVLTGPVEKAFSGIVIL